MQEAQRSIAFSGAESTSRPAFRANLVSQGCVRINNNSIYLAAKRFFDFTSALMLAIAMLIPMAIVALVIRLDSPGPAIFKQERLGQDGKPFMMYKFRSMIQDAESCGPVWSQKEDARCTRVGRVIRKVRIDELPQLFNIIRGDMSVVGPRPERTHFYREFDLYIPDFKYRLMAKPGLTGLAQVNGGYDLLPEEKIVYDLEYMANRTLWMDFKLILKTAGVVFSREGAR